MIGLGMGVFGLVWMLLFWGGLIALVVWLVGLIFPSIKAQNDADAPTHSAQDILKARYAQGQLTQTEYQQMLQTIQQ